MSNPWDDLSEEAKDALVDFGELGLAEAYVDLAATIQRVREAAAYLHWVAAHTDDTMPHNRAIATTYNNAAQIIREALGQEEA